MPQASKEDSANVADSVLDPDGRDSEAGESEGAHREEDEEMRGGVSHKLDSFILNTVPDLLVGGRLGRRRKEAHAVAVEVPAHQRDVRERAALERHEGEQSQWECDEHCWEDVDRLSSQ